VVHTLALGSVEIDLIEKIGAAAQIETERHLLLQERRPLRHRLRRESIGQSEDHPERAGAQDHHQQPSLEIKHLSAFGGRAAYRSPSIRRHAGVFASSGAVTVAGVPSSFAGASGSLLLSSFAGSVLAST